ncbi:apolipoprotein N-acyltransferase [Neptunicella marina]|uniref:Apolipoprotein N-acyltransferase n=1 Tax=Neptunicella marina TaxID=2125989 RepID=A0A8J6LZW4_9ALTE|nr:apolipoprotein N-acyltransferase [Neptunicella marina]MBC3764377.1 apolipoprotein N-acyltransferase [Neptunicella marina]
MHKLLSILLGAGLTLSYAPYSQWYLSLVFVSLFFVLLNSSTQSKTQLGWFFGLGWFGAGISWVHVSIDQYGGIPLIGSLALMLLLSAYLALYPALFTYLLNRYVKKAYWPLAAPGVWLICEWLRAHVFTGFPWLSLGYSQIDGPLAGWLPVLGEFGVSALLILIGSFIGQSIIQKRYKNSLIVLVVSLLAGWTLNQYNWVSETLKPARVSLVQGNIAQSLRWVPENDLPTMQKYQHMSEHLWAQSDIIIWPEAAIPKLEPLSQEYLKQLNQTAADSNTALITGILNYNFESRQAYNGMIVLGKRNADDTEGHYQYNHDNRYAKHHLLPIGEFIPFESWLRGIAPLFDLPMSSFSRGDYIQPNLEANGYFLDSALCYEIVFADQVRANLQDNTDFIITLSNDAWFADSHGPAQHMEIARVRAKEFALPLIRSTNNGITALVDHKGEFIIQAPQYQEASITATLEHVKSMTPYRLLGNSLPFTLCLILLLLVYYQQKKRAE